jgi:hypothetical protein
VEVPGHIHLDGIEAQRLHTGQAVCPVGGGDAVVVYGARDDAEGAAVLQEDVSSGSYGEAAGADARLARGSLVGAGKHGRGTGEAFCCS